MLGPPQAQHRHLCNNTKSSIEVFHYQSTSPATEQVVLFPRYWAGSMYVHAHALERPSEHCARGDDSMNSRRPGCRPTGSFLSSACRAHARVHSFDFSEPLTLFLFGCLLITTSRNLFVDLRLVLLLVIKEDSNRFFRVYLHSRRDKMLWLPGRDRRNVKILTFNL